MRIKKIPLSSPKFPLPADYDTLTVDGQRLARCNAASQWRFDEDKKIRHFYSVSFFDNYYLKPDEGADFNPFFYNKPPVDDPAYLSALYGMWMDAAFSICIAPRGAGKSISIKKELLMEMVTCPGRKISYATSSGDNAKGVGNDLRHQVVDNERIVDDFGVEGKMLPTRGKGAQGAMFFELINYSRLKCYSSEAKIRGDRPDVFVLDDPEYDAKAGTSMPVIRGYMDQLISAIILPMVMTGDASARWMATFVSQRHYAWHAMEVEKVNGKWMAKDSRFDYWTRMKIKAIVENAKGEKESCWPSMWPIDKKTRLEKAKTDPSYFKKKSLQEIKRAIGTGAFLAEYMASPGQGDEIYFPELKKKDNGWWYEERDGLEEDNPRKSSTRICYWNRKGEDLYEMRRVPLREFLRDARIFSTVDTSYTATPSSDLKCHTVMAIDSDNNQVVLDIWSNIAQHADLTEAIKKMALKWRPGSIHPEFITAGIVVTEDLETWVGTAEPDEWRPAIVPHRPGVDKKTAKIAALITRVNEGKLKLPLWSKVAPVRRLLDQFADFNPDADNGGLGHDDEIDTVQMGNFIIKGRIAAPVQEEEQVETLIDRIRSGETHDEMGIPLAAHLPLSGIPIHDIIAAAEQHNDAEQHPESFV